VEVGELVENASGRAAKVVAVKGEHDLNTAPELRARLDELIDARTPVLVDLSPATFVDSSILGVILDARRVAQEAGVGFEVASDDGAAAVGRVLEITGLRAELPVHESIEAAAQLVGATEGSSG
jgi:anti-sigma B factor antagonist